MRTWFGKLFAYHAWANEDLFGKLATLDPVVQQTELEKAIRIISHHHLVARIFAAHLNGVAHHYASDTVAETPALGDLHAAVAASDRWYLGFVDGVSPAQLAEFVPFVFTDGDKGYMTREEMLNHVVLHSAIHRGEVARLLTQMSITPPWDTFAVYLHRTEPARRLQLNI